MPIIFNGKSPFNAVAGGNVKRNCSVYCETKCLGNRGHYKTFMKRCSREHCNMSRVKVQDSHNFYCCKSFIFVFAFMFSADG